MPRPQLALPLLLLTSLAMAAEPNTLSTSESDDGWTLLFDGENLDQWRTYGESTLPGGWRAEDGTLALVEPGAGDIVTRDVYGNFELVLDWRIAEAGNSGIFILVDEDENPIYHNAPEIQILDNEKHSDREIDSHRSGSLYDLIASHPSSHKPQGEWNTVRIRFEDGLLNIWQNDVPTATIVIGSSAWTTLLANSKFADWDGFGESRRGRIGLQDHGDKVWFRNIKIRRLD